MMRPLSPRESRLVAVLILVAVVALAQFAVIAPIMHGFADRAEQRRELRARYAANDRMIAAIPRLRRQAETRNALLRHYTLAAPDPGAAAEMLRDRLQSAVTAIGGDPRGGEDIPAPPGTVAARVNARLASPQLTALLVTLQNARPAITVTAMAISADDALVSGQSTTLDVQLEASIPFRPALAR